MKSGQRSIQRRLMLGFMVTTGIALAVASGSFFTTENTGIVCFAEGTLISTPRGPVPVEELGSGDMVITRDAGPQRILRV